MQQKNIYSPHGVHGVFFLIFGTYEIQQRKIGPVRRKGIATQRRNDRTESLKIHRNDEDAFRAWTFYKDMDCLMERNQISKCSENYRVYFRSQIDTDDTSFYFEWILDPPLVITTG
jgi:hypothetical protein|uniref:Uncharacterized protein n=1 Tax=Sipha flava TaxID=143950 RepID=A0A2S2QU10_9HEMI